MFTIRYIVLQCQYLIFYSFLHLALRYFSQTIIFGFYGGPNQYWLVRVVSSNLSVCPVPVLVGDYYNEQDGRYEM